MRTGPLEVGYGSIAAPRSSMICFETVLSAPDHRNITTPAESDITAPMESPSLGAVSTGTRVNNAVINKPPAVCPESRARLCSPPAALLRSRGADRNILRLLGTLKKPNPIPQRIVQKLNVNGPKYTGRIAARPSPTERSTPPAKQSHAGEIRFASLPTTGAMDATASGQGVRYRPVITGDMPCAFWKWNGKATNAALTPVKHITDAMTDIPKDGVRRRSSGMRGEA